MKNIGGAISGASPALAAAKAAKAASFPDEYLRTWPGGDDDDEGGEAEGGPTALTTAPSDKWVTVPARASAAASSRVPSRRLPDHLGARPVGTSTGTDGSFGRGGAGGMPLAVPLPHRGVGAGAVAGGASMGAAAGGAAGAAPAEARSARFATSGGAAPEPTVGPNIASCTGGPNP